jgi:hypothetical protein
MPQWPYYIKVEPLNPIDAILNVDETFDLHFLFVHPLYIFYHLSH